MADDFGVSVEENFTENVDVAIYQNLVNEDVTISLKSVNYNDKFKLSIYTIGGICMYSEKIQNESSINFIEHGMTPGIYLLRVEGEKNIITKKLIVTNE